VNHQSRHKKLAPPGIMALVVVYLERLREIDKEDWEEMFRY